MLSPEHETVVCTHCFGAMVISSQFPKKPLRFCVYCGVSLGNGDVEGATQGSMGGSDWGASLISGQVPSEDPIQFTIGPYQILRKIGEGGMGEVFLAYDVACGRRIALKQIRRDLKGHKTLYNRFLKEARITSQLSHPAIVPIYAIERTGDLLYYTMPYLEGHTLKQLLRDVRKSEKEGKRPPEGTIPHLIRIFISICQAIAYAHSKGVLHRDIKPENVIVMRYGEAKILDWGLADLSGAPDEKLAESTKATGLTRIGKVVGTLSYMAPERALGSPATIQTEIYALGVILYQLLTLNLPFKRKSLADFKAKGGDDTPLKDPIELAPYRDIPQVLVSIVEKCLQIDPKKRYGRVQEMINELESYIEGRSEWFNVQALSPIRSQDWEFQENVLMDDFNAISRSTEETSWVNLMISEATFPGNIRLETEVEIKEGGEGFGILFSLKEREERLNLLDGYCLWISALPGTPTRLIRSGVHVVESPDLLLKVGRKYRIAVEKVDESIHLLLDGRRVFSYITHLPQEGAHVGLMLRDTFLEMTDLQVYEAGQNVLVKCIAVPDAFLANKDYAKALSEYRRIGASFPGRQEGREAFFRAGVTLLEQGKASALKLERESCFELAFQEFEKLRKTPGAPLEYLGKSLIYEALGEFQEEAKCFDIAYRRTPRHPLLPLLEEHLLFRTQESSRIDRIATYQFSLLLILHCPEKTFQEGKRLLDRLQRNTETPWFLDPIGHRDLPSLGIEIAYHLSQGHVIEEFLQIKPTHTLFKRALFCLLDCDQSYDSIPIELKPTYEALKELQMPANKDKTALLWLSSKLLYLGRYEESYSVLGQIVDPLSSEELEWKGFFESTVLILMDRFEEAGKVLDQFPVEKLSDEDSPLFFPFGCLLHRSEGKEIAKIHFQDLLEASFPRSSALGAYYFTHKLDFDRWVKQAFFWEKRTLALQMMLMSKASQDQKQFNHWKGFLDGK